MNGTNKAGKAILIVDLTACMLLLGADDDKDCRFLNHFDPVRVTEEG